VTGIQMEIEVRLGLKATVAHIEGNTAARETHRPGKFALGKQG